MICEGFVMQLECVLVVWVVDELDDIVEFFVDFVVWVDVVIQDIVVGDGLVLVVIFGGLISMVL